MRIALVFLVFLLLTAAPVSAADTSDAGTRFLQAVAAGDLTNVRSMLDRDPSLANARRPNGNSAVILALFQIGEGERAFHDAATNELLKTILARSPKFALFETAALGTAGQLDALLRKEPEAIKRRNPFGWTLLHLAAFAGNTATAELLLKKGAPVEARAESKFRNTPLQAALLSGQLATTKLLIDHGADVLVRQSKGATPMHESALLGRQDLVQLLLDHGAELNSVSDNGQTPLAEALRGNHTELAEWMKARGAVVGTQPDEDVAAKKQ